MWRQKHKNPHNNPPFAAAAIVNQYVLGYPGEQTAHNFLSGILVRVQVLNI